MAENSSSRRVQRYEKLVRQIASEFLIHHINEPNMGWAQVTRAHVSADLRSAKVYIHFQDSENPEEELKVLQSYAHQLQQSIHRQVRSKYCPKVQFILDKNFEKVLRVERLIHQLNINSEPQV